MVGQAPYDARAVANFLLDLAESRRKYLTQISLYKILYFAHGWYLSKTGTPLVKQDFEAWERGPVIKILRDQFKKFGKSVITDRAERLDIFSGQREVVRLILSHDDKLFVKAILDEYQGYNPWELSDMTHEAGSPWDKVWNAKEPVGRLALRLTNKEIKAHFDSLPARVRVS